MSVNTERPGIYTAYRISQILYSNSGSSGIVAAAAAADSGEVMRVYTITSYSDAASKFGASSQMAELIKILILNKKKMNILIKLKMKACMI